MHNLKVYWYAERVVDISRSDGIRSLLSTINQSRMLLPKKDRFKLYGLALFQIAITSLDILGVVLIGFIATVSTSAIQGVALPSLTTRVLTVLGMSEWAPQDIAKVLGALAAFVLVSKSIINYNLSVKSLSFLARREAEISSTLAQRIFSNDLVTLQRFTTPEFQFAMTGGSNLVTVGILGQSMILISELTLQVALVITILSYSPSLFLICITFFTLLFLLLNYVLGSRATRWGKELTIHGVKSNRLISDALNSYREVIVMNRRNFFIDEIKRARSIVAEKGIRTSMLSQISKYIFESSAIVLGVLVAAYAFLTRNAIEAMGVIAVFLAASTRLAPSLMKIQVSWIALKTAVASSFKFFEILHAFPERNSSQVSASDTSLDDQINKIREGEFEISFTDVDFTYPGSELPAVSKVNFNIRGNTSVAFVGPSGGGKSTIVDLLLGVSKPNSGSIQICGQSPEVLTSASFGIFGYVPQKVFLSQGSILENICLGVPKGKQDIVRAKECLSVVGLLEWVNDLPHGLETEVGESGNFLSGGQRQRIGIARALYPSPRILVLDEATSALDAESEAQITIFLESMKSHLTLVLIAHRLSTVMNVDKLFYVSSGSIVKSGSFSDLRKYVPNFDKQANLMGIN